MSSAEIENIDLKSRIIVDTPDAIVIDKPAGLETIVTGGGNAKFCLRSMLRRQLGIATLAPVHRLDRDTTGCLIVARDEAKCKPLEEAFRQRTVQKDYLGICFGVPRRRHGVIRCQLSNWTAGRTPIRVVKAGGHDSQTEYRVLADAQSPVGAISLIRFHPLTGRTHQIRIHCQLLSCPILGDDRYGDRNANRIAANMFALRRHALHAWRINMDVPGGKKISAVAPLPDDMLAIARAFFPQELKKLGK